MSWCGDQLSSGVNHWISIQQSASFKFRFHICIILQFLSRY
uniref:Uncharacterized protein n=1 Tax=Rhizophora mucronata TaxID=61149 RepID=A0A2P2P5V6_RHIMU